MPLNRFEGVLFVVCGLAHDEWWQCLPSRHGCVHLWTSTEYLFGGILEESKVQRWKFEGCFHCREEYDGGELLNRVAATDGERFCAVNWGFEATTGMSATPCFRYECVIEEESKPIGMCRKDWQGGIHLSCCQWPSIAPLYTSPRQRG